MNSADLLLDVLDRGREVALGVLDGLSDDTLVWRAGPEANTIAWLVWHLARQADVQVSPLADRDQVWVSDGFVDRFDLDLPPDAMGYGMSADDVAKVRAPAALLGEYVEAVWAMLHDYVSGLADDDLDEVVDEHWDPPVTLGVRLVSVAGDAAQHAGQAAYVKGLREG